MTTNKLLTEIERQNKYLDQLPESFTFPLFNSKKLLNRKGRAGTAIRPQQHEKLSTTPRRHRRGLEQADHGFGHRVVPGIPALPTDASMPAAAKRSLCRIERFWVNSIARRNTPSWRSR